MADIRNMVMPMKLFLIQNVPIVHILNNESETVHCTNRVIITKEHYGIRSFKVIIIRSIFAGHRLGRVIMPSGLVLFKAHSPHWASAKIF